MAKMTLLAMTQSILSAMDSDPVDSIDETVESIQVAELVKEAYYDLINLRDWPWTRQLASLEGLGDVGTPTKMRMPELMGKVFWVKYNKKEVKYMPPHEFDDMIDARPEVANAVDANGFRIDRDPTYWTSYDDEYVVFDAINLSEEATLQTSKSKVYATLSPSWSSSDGFIPDIPEKFFPTLLAEAKSQAFVNIKQQSNNREEFKAKRGRTTMQNESWRNNNGEHKFNTKVNYGRK
jgi:hypothetical protein